MNTYPLGNAITLSATFTVASTGSLGDPSIVKLRIKDPLNVETDYTGGVLSHPSTGVFQYVLTPAIPGVWKYRWEGTGTLVAASERKIEIQPSSFESD
jgi:hypothetical protein